MPTDSSESIVSAGEAKANAGYAVDHLVLMLAATRVDSCWLKRPRRPHDVSMETSSASVKSSHLGVRSRDDCGVLWGVVKMKAVLKTRH